MIFHILTRNKEINNETISIDGMSDKLEEEFLEVKAALKDYDKNQNSNNLTEIVRETFDVIQVCILILYRVNKRARKLNKPNLIKRILFEHNAKLSGRGWEMNKEIEVKVK